MRRTCALVLTAALLATQFFCAPVFAQEKRIALLIGNQSYDASVGVLKNPHNDIALLAGALQTQGYEVLPLVKDARRGEILSAVRQFASRLVVAGPGAIGLFYYSGHGAAERDTSVNYLIPVDVRDPGSPSFWDESVKLDEVMRLLERAQGAHKFIVFDACRSELQLQTRDSSRGLLPVVQQQGFFVSLASAPGQAASDRGERSGPYAAALAAELLKPGMDHLNLFQNVKETVITSTGGSQHPWESNGLSRRVYLAGQKVGALPAESTSIDAQPIEAADQAEIAQWDAARNAGDIPALERFLARFPQGSFAGAARAMIERLKDDAARRASQVAGLAGSGPIVAGAAAPAAKLAVRSEDVVRLTREVQAELVRVGCSMAPADGVWSAANRDALRQFARIRMPTLPADEPSVEARDAMKVIPGRVCPLVCADDEGVLDGRCVPNARPSPRRSKVRETVLEQPAVRRPPQRESERSRPERRREVVVRTPKAERASSQSRKGSMCWGDTGRGLQLVPCDDPRRRY